MLDKTPWPDDDARDSVPSAPVGDGVGSTAEPSGQAVSEEMAAEEVVEEPGGAAQHTALPPKIESWRRRSAAGAILTGFALGLRDVFEPERQEAPIVMETSGEPPLDLPVEAQVENARPRHSVVTLRPWLMGGAAGTAPQDEPASGEAALSAPAVGEPARGEAALSAPALDEPDGGGRPRRESPCSATEAGDSADEAGRRPGEGADPAGPGPRPGEAGNAAEEAGRAGAGTEDA